MKQEEFHEDPDRIASDRYDCIWIWFSERSKPSPLASVALQWLDWKMLGALSRFILGEKPNTTLFMPTMGKIESPYLALEPGKNSDWASFVQNCEGLGLKSVLCFTEDNARASWLAKELGRQALKSSLFTVGADRLDGVSD